jgi:hypothetical protein
MPRRLPPRTHRHYPVDAHSASEHIAMESVNAALRKENMDLKKQNLALRSLAIHGIIYRLESLAGTSCDVGRCARLLHAADRWRAMRAKLLKEIRGHTK